MKILIKPLALLTLTTAISACASDSTTMQANPVAMQSTPLGDVITTPDGMTLYTFAKDSQGVSNCYGGCEQKWPPFIVSGDTTNNWDFTTITRKNGEQQWAYKGMPLYRWINDQQPGDITGHGIKNIWFIARADDVPVKVFRNQEQSVLTDLSQRSLYTFDKDTQGQSNCYGKCAELWPPLMADNNAKKSGSFDVTKRKDGKLQWTLNGQPLYTWIKDQQAGDITGDGVKGVWHIVKQP
ncbi:MAG: hypothetical protein V7731_04585 [Amphritea sp.]